MRAADREVAAQPKAEVFGVREKSDWQKVK